MNSLCAFSHEQFGSVRCVNRDGDSWFVGNDICDALDLGNPRSSLALLDDDEKGVYTVDTPGGKQGMAVISEAGLYSLILRSRKPEAKAFKRWVTHEVLPAIRKHGGYLTPAKIEEVLTDPDTIIRLATDLKAERQQRVALECQAAIDRPKVVFADAVDASSTSILVGDLAKILRQNGVMIGQNRLFGWLRENGYLMERHGDSWNMPSQRSMEMGLFEIKERTIVNPDGSIRTTKTTKITGKGQIYFVNKFKGVSSMSLVQSTA